MRTPLAVMILALAACGEPPGDGRLAGAQTPAVNAPTPAPEPKPKPEPEPQGTAIASVGDLVGEYRVAGIDDAEISGNKGIALSIDGPLMSFGPTCAGFEWTIGFDGETLRTSRHSGAAGSSLGEPSRPVCAVAVTPAERALAQALDAATRAERTPANGIRLSGGGHSVTLFSQ